VSECQTAPVDARQSSPTGLRAGPASSGTCTHSPALTLTLFAGGGLPRHGLLMRLGRECLPRHRQAPASEFSTLAQRAPIALLFLALFNSILGLSILFPILGPLGRQLGLNEVHIGWLSSGYSLMQLLASPWWGRRSERIGRRPVLLTGIFGFCIGFGSFGIVAWLGTRGILTGTALFAALLACRVVGGALSAATLPTAQAYVADVTPRERRTSGMALIGAAFGLGIVFGPAIGAGLAHFGLLTPVFVSAAVALLNGVFVYGMLPEPERREVVADASPRSSLAVAWPLLLVGLGLTLSTVALEQTVAFLYQDVLHLSAQSAARHVGIALALYGVAAVLSQGVLARRSHVPPTQLLLISLPLTALGLTCTALSHQFWTLTGSLVLQGLGSGLAMPALAAALSLEVGDDRQGEVAGLNSSAQALGRTLGPLLGTALYAAHHRTPYWAGAALAGLLWIALLLRPGRLARPQPN
jgi:MFS family permease